jgi:tetratricopeptide (TPR) repeat protein
MILIWASLAGLISPRVHARETKDLGKKLTAPAQRLLIEVRERMSKADYQGAIALILAGRKTTDNTSGTETSPATHPLVCLALANCYLMIPDYPHAESAYLAALALTPDLMDARVNLAKVYSDTSQFDKAAPAFLAAYELSDPRQADYLYYSAVMTLNQGRAEAAIGYFERLFAAHPDQVVGQWQQNFATALMATNRWKQALPLVRELVAQTTDREKIRWQEALLQIYLQTDDLNQALTYATTLSRQNVTVAKWWKALVHIHLILGHYPQALDNLIVYGFISPLTRKEAKLFADLSLQLGIPGRAVLTYETLLAEDKDTALDAKEQKQMIQRLVTAYRQLDQSAHALALLNRFDPETCDPEILMLKGNLLYEAKAFKAADETFRRTARNDCPQKGQAWLMAGYAAWQQNDLEASHSAFKRAARFKRQRKDALAAMAQLERIPPL